jgi:LEA14-like dessication related protein
MKKVFLFGGIALAGFGLYRYFKYQIDLALNYQYALKDFKILPQTKEGVINVSAVFSITNKSSFKVVVKDYDLQLFFKDVEFARTKSTKSITVQPNSTFEVTGYGEINVEKSKIAILPFVKDVFDRKPIDVAVSGKINIVFLGIPTSLSFNKEKFNYSVDLIKEYNLAPAYEKLKAKYPKVFSFLGIKK